LPWVFHPGFPKLPIGIEESQERGSICDVNWKLASGYGRRARLVISMKRDLFASYWVDWMFDRIPCNKVHRSRRMVRIMTACKKVAKLTHIKRQRREFNKLTDLTVQLFADLVIIFESLKSKQNEQCILCEFHTEA
jgi:hypothetical protein